MTNESLIDVVRNDDAVPTGIRSSELFQIWSLGACICISVGPSHGPISDICMTLVPDLDAAFHSATGFALLFISHSI
jgi:hypothetical protein